MVDIRLPTYHDFLLQGGSFLLLESFLVLPERGWGAGGSLRPSGIPKHLVPLVFLVLCFLLYSMICGGTFGAGLRLSGIEPENVYMGILLSV